MVKHFNNIIVPTDGSNVAKKALKKAIYLAEKTDTKLVVIHVINIPYVPSVFETADEIPYVEVHELLKKRGTDILKNAENMAKQSKASIELKLLEGHPAEQIVKMSKKNDLIVIGNKGMTALDRIFLGSVSEYVTHHAACAVMIVK
jgi:nucleotide-binding universal stress UspA family protein